MNCEYVRENYRVPAEIGRIVSYKNRMGIIAADRGNYIGVNFDDVDVDKIVNIHPTDKSLKYFGIGIVRS